jgi:hypothetical protein
MDLVGAPVAQLGQPRTLGVPRGTVWMGRKREHAIIAPSGEMSSSTFVPDVSAPQLRVGIRTGWRQGWFVSGQESYRGRNRISAGFVSVQVSYQGRGRIRARLQACRKSPF